MDSADPDCPRKNEKAKKFWSFVKFLKKDAVGMVQYESHDRAAPASPNLLGQKLTKLTYLFIS